jgi:tetratricopeptide (TPR) repeat protein
LRGPTAPEPGAVLFDNLGTYHHPISTRVPDAQRYFDQGFVLVYAFNHEEATRAFEQAARLDPECAMPWWGIALAAGPNYNDPGGRERFRRAHEAIEKAKTLRASAIERDYIAAMGTRYVAEPSADRKALDVAYAGAMRDLSQKYPDDLDAKTLYADALMNLRPWDLWTADGKPQPGTEEAVAALESVLARSPDHPGANHLYVHAVEASPTPGRALAAADRLRALVPGAGHLVHMPSHIYMRVGRYDEAVAANERAVAADREYIARVKPAGMYPMMYYPHNLDFLWAAASMEGRSADTIRVARELAAETTAEMARQMSDIEGGLVAPAVALARFGRWQEVLAEAAPPDDLPFARGMWHYTRGLAFTRTGRLDEAAKELKQVRAVAAVTPPGRMIQQVNTAKSLLGIADHVLAGELASAHGRNGEAVKHLKAAVRRQDALRYMEPPPWYYPVRQSLGAVLLASGRAREAEAVYREDLRRNPENGWSLVGLAASLRKEGRDDAARAVEDRFQKAWARADVRLTSSRF